MLVQIGEHTGHLHEESIIWRLGTWRHGVMRQWFQDNDEVIVSPRTHWWWVAMWVAETWDMTSWCYETMISRQQWNHCLTKSTLVVGSNVNNTYKCCSLNVMVTAPVNIELREIWVYCSRMVKVLLQVMFPLQLCQSCNQNITWQWSSQVQGCLTGTSLPTTSPGRELTVSYMGWSLGRPVGASCLL